MPEFSPAFAGGEPGDLKELQAEEARLLSLYDRPKNVKRTEITIPGSEVSIPARLYQPIDNGGNGLAGNRPLLVWFHGGAFVFGNIEMGEAEFTSCEIAARAGAVVINVEYRLANPFQRFPVCQVDGLDAVQWAINNASELGIDVNKVFVGGASAGACLSGSVSLMLRDRGVQIAGVLPIYPTAHIELPDMNDVQRKAVEDIVYFTQEFTNLHNPWLMENINDTDAHHCWPGDAADKSGQAPFLIVHAERDSLRASGELWGQQLRAAGVTVREFIESQALHGYLSMGPTNAGCDHTLDLMTDFILQR